MADSARQDGFVVRVPHSIATAAGLVIQIMVAGVLFLIVGAVAVALNLATKLCEAEHWAPTFVIYGMKALETLLWMIDVVCCVLFLVREGFDFCATTVSRRRR